MYIVYLFEALLINSVCIFVQVHGGTTNNDIKQKVEEAEKIAQDNVQKYGQHMYTVLFFDEANTTESIGLIKEIMCDKSIEGRKLKVCNNLKMVAACNPYRKYVCHNPTSGTSKCLESSSDFVRNKTHFL